MNFKSNLALLFSFGALVLCFYLMYKISNLDSKVVPESQPASETTKEKASEVPIEIAHFMNRIQVFHNKLYFAGMNKNTRLAQFYLDEIEEEMGVIAEAGVFSVDPEVIQQIKPYGLKQVEWMRSQIDKGMETFASDFDQLTTSCNSCHTVTKHDYVKIAVPTAPIFTNQDYNP